jgi:cytochrome c-type biogenesis protein CcmE
MTKLISSRLIYILVSLLLLIISILITAKVFNESIVYFYSPSDVITIHPKDNFRLGGLIKNDSIKTLAPNTVDFIVTDLENEISVRYIGIVPTLFKEGQGAIAYGKMLEGKFIAQEILAKHDENYMPKEIAESLKTNGLWKNNPKQ